MEAVACVSGATSQIGIFLLPRLHAAGFEVLALSRGAQAASRPVDGVLWMPPEVLLGGAVSPGPSALVSCGPLELARQIVDAAPGLRRVVAFSSSSVLSKADSGSAAERRSMAEMAEHERDLRDACAARDLPLLLLRPTLIYGCGLDRNVSLLAAVARRFGTIPLAGPAAGLRQPVHADDLAALSVWALQRPKPVQLVSPACGGETLRFREMAHRIAAAAPRRARLLSIPESLMAGAVRALSLFPRWRGLDPEMVRRQNRDLVFDDTPLREALDWNPRPFAPTPADFSIPAHARALQLPEP